MFGQESFATCCMIMLHVSSHNVIRRSVLCQWTFYKFKWWVRWVKKPFSQKFCAHPPLFPKIFVLHRGTNAENLRSGVRAEKNLRSKVLHLFGMEFRFAILRRRNPKETKDIKESPFYFILFEVIRNPHVSALRCKKVSAV